MITLNCKNCGKEYSTYPSKAKAVTTCSKECSRINRSVITKGRANTWAYKYKKERIIRPCKTCGAEIHFLEHEVTKDLKKIYCSTKCSGEDRRGRKTLVPLKCAFCGKDFLKRRDHVNGKNYCSKSCSHASKKIENPKNPQNREYMKEYLKEYNRINKEKLAVGKKKWLQENKEKRKEVAAKYRTNNKEKIRVIHTTRKNVTLVGNLTVQEWEEILEKSNYQCLSCKKSNSEAKLTLDHIIPISKGGRHEKENVQPLCKSCNSKKNTKTIDYRPPASCPLIS